MSKWIWKFGEFEVYHNLLLHNRRQQYGYPEPAVWKLYPTDPVVRFRKEVNTGGDIHVTACGNFSVKVSHGNEKPIKYGGKEHITLEPGLNVIEIRVSNPEAFPCLFVYGAVESDETWLADDLTSNWAKVGSYAEFSHKNMPPITFPFEYQPITYVNKEILGCGVLFDFGKETFAQTTLTNLSLGKVRVQFGESREEALDKDWSVIRFDDTPVNHTLKYPPYAFRYIFVNDVNADITAEYEYLPLQYKGSFECNEAIINDVWKTAAYTFHLNCREFILDGIKRDRWVWSADFYQSIFVNRYLFLDQDLEKRTLIALGGKKPFCSHINTIMDYTFFWFISLYEYYKTYGDIDFIRQMEPQMQEVMTFCLGRCDSDGFMREKPGDWIFIDWADMDKTGALCGEQILFAKALECFSLLCEAIGCDDRKCGERSKAVRQNILKYFYDEPSGVFIDSYESGKRNITRQCNILAYLFLPCNERLKKNIYEKVILNAKVPPITTPYFKFYENRVHCEEHNTGLLEASLRDYFGAMLKLGATTFYEEFDPSKSGTEHFAMYGHAYEKSLCHAWSASPVYLLGHYRLGVKNTGIGYSTFEVRPNLGDLKHFSGTVPVPGGRIEVTANAASISVYSDIPGGTLIIADKAYPIPGKVRITVPHIG